jgi:hypothetical protein
MNELGKFVFPSVAEVGLNNWARKYRAPFFEVKVGAGRVIVCEMCVSAGTADPIARRFAANLFAWLIEKR